MENSAEYDCKFGPDRNGNYEQHVVTSSTALNCGGFCECTGLTNNTCLFGPDENGHFITSVSVPSEEVDTCARAWCTCNTHSDVILLLADGQTTFDEIIATRASVGNIIVDARVFDTGVRIPTVPEEEQEIIVEESPEQVVVIEEQPVIESPVTTDLQQQESGGSFLMVFGGFCIFLLLLLIALYFIYKRYIQNRGKDEKMQDEWMMHAGPQPRKVSFKNGKKYELQNEQEKSDIELDVIGSAEHLKEQDGHRNEADQGSERKLLGSGNSNKEAYGSQQELIDVGDIEIGLKNPPQRKGSWGAPLGGRRPSNKKKSENWQINEPDRESSIPPVESYVESEEGSLSNTQQEEQKEPQQKEFEPPEMSFQRERSTVKKGYVAMPSNTGSDLPREETNSDIASYRSQEETKRGPPQSSQQHDESSFTLAEAEAVIESQPQNVNQGHQETWQAIINTQGSDQTPIEQPINNAAQIEHAQQQWIGQVQDQPYQQMKEERSASDSFTPEDDSKLSAEKFKEERVEPEAPQELQNNETQSVHSEPEEDQPNQI